MLDLELLMDSFTGSDLGVMMGLWTSCSSLTSYLMTLRGGSMLGFYTMTGGEIGFGRSSTIGTYFFRLLTTGLDWFD